MTVKVRFEHVRKLGYCSSGLRRFCDKYGFNVTDFKHGVDADLIRATGDPYGEKVADLATASEADK